MSREDFKGNCLKTHADDPFVESDMLYQGAKTLVVAGSPRAWLSLSELHATVFEPNQRLSTCHRS